MGKKFDTKPDDPADDEPAIDDFYDDDWEEWERHQFEELLQRVREGREPYHPNQLKDIEYPEWRKEMIEAICLGTINRRS